MSVTYEGMSPGGHETYATSIFSKIKTYLDSNPYGYLTTHQDISGKADKSATVSTVTWSNNKLTKTINGTTSDVVSAATILSNLTSSQVTTALGYTPASVNTTYDFESSDNSISFMGRAVGSVETVDMTVNGKVSTEGDTISGDYINTANFIEAGVTGKRVTTYGPWGIDIDEYVGTSLWSKLALRDSDILLTKTWDGTHDSLKATIAYLGSQSAVNKVDKAGDTMTGDISWNGETGYTSGLYWKEHGYGDKFKIAPSFSGFNDDNFLGFQAAVGGAGTDPSLSVILKIHPSGKITTTNQVIGKNPASSWIGARDAACFKNPNFANNGSYYPVISTKSKSGTWSMGVLSNEEQLNFCWESDSNYSSGKNESTRVILRATAGTIALTSELTWNKISGKPIVIGGSGSNKTVTAGTPMNCGSIAVTAGVYLITYMAGFPSGQANWKTCGAVVSTGNGSSSPINKAGLCNYRYGYDNEVRVHGATMWTASGNTTLYLNLWGRGSGALGGCFGEIRAIRLY